jgi:hypothetical protein
MTDLCNSREISHFVRNDSLSLSEGEYGAATPPHTPPKPRLTVIPKGAKRNEESYCHYRIMHHFLEYAL